MKHRDQPGGERVDAAEQAVEPHGCQGLGQHDAQFENDAKARHRGVFDEVGQRAGGVVGDVELAADNLVAECSCDG